MSVGRGSWLWPPLSRRWGGRLWPPLCWWSADSTPVYAFAAGLRGGLTRGKKGMGAYH